MKSDVRIVETTTFSVKLKKQLHDQTGGGSKEATISVYDDSIGIGFEELKDGVYDGMPVVIEHHDGNLRLLIYVDDEGEPLEYPNIIILR